MEGWRGGLMRNGHNSVPAKIAFALIALGVLFGGCGRPHGESRETLRIGLVYIGPHELINQIVTGFKDGVTQNMGTEPFEIVEKHAKNDKSQISPTVDATIASGLDVLATITTPVSQVALKDAPATLPIVFVGVTDPIGAGLVKSMEKPQICTGVSDLAPLGKLLSVIREV